MLRGGEGQSLCLGTPAGSVSTNPGDSNRAIADASGITGLPRDMFEVHEIAKEEFEALRSR